MSPKETPNYIDKLDIMSFDEKINEAVKARFNTELNAAVNQGFPNRHSATLIWLEKALLVILLVASAFIGYQQWQQSLRLNELVEQSQQTNQLVKQLSPANQTNPSPRVSVKP